MVKSNLSMLKFHLFGGEKVPALMILRSAEVVDLLTDAAKRLGADAQKLRKSGSAAKGKDCGDM